MVRVLLQAHGSQWSFVTQQVQHVPGGRPSLLAQCVDLDMHLYYVAVKNLVYECGNVPQITAEISDTHRLIVQQSVDKSI